MSPEPHDPDGPNGAPRYITYTVVQVLLTLLYVSMVIVGFGTAALIILLRM